MIANIDFMQVITSNCTTILYNLLSLRLCLLSLYVYADYLYMDISMMVYLDLLIRFTIAFSPLFLFELNILSASLSNAHTERFVLTFRVQLLFDQCWVLKMLSDLYVYWVHRLAPNISV